LLFFFGLFMLLVGVCDVILFVTVDIVSVGLLCAGVLCCLGYYAKLKTS
jgi:hypothetical protein